MRTCVIFNPAAKGDKARRFFAQLDVIGAGATFKKTTAAGDARRLAAEAVQEGFEIIAAAGGDGTLNEALNGIADADGFARTRLAMLPLGTVNVFAREMGIPRKPAAAWAALQAGHGRTIDVPWVEFSEKGRTQRRYFAQMAGAGLDARAIELVSWSLKKKLGPLAYVWAGVKAALEPQPPLTVTADGQSLTGELILIGNGRKYGGDFRIFPEADMADGLLDVCVFPRASLFTVLAHAPSLLTRGLLRESAVRRLRTARFTITAAGPHAAKASGEVDGEWAARLPLTFGVEKACLQIVGIAAL